MIGKKDTHCIFEQYRSVLKEQVDDRVKALLSAIAISDLDEEFKKGLNNLLSDPEVATKWKGGPVKSINDGDPNFANEMGAAQKAQNAAYPESEVKKFLGEEEEENEAYQNCGSIVDLRAKAICIQNRNKIMSASMAAQGKVDPKKVLRR